MKIEDPMTDRLARELAAATGEPIPVAIRVAIEERLSRIRRRDAATAKSAVLNAILRRGRERMTADARSEDEILGYGSEGPPA